jgi:hypothetical protein
MVSIASIWRWIVQLLHALFVALSIYFWELKCWLAWIPVESHLMRSILPSQVRLVSLLDDWLSLSTVEIGPHLISYDALLVIVKLFFAVLTVEVLYYVLSILGKAAWITLLLYPLAIDVL